MYILCQKCLCDSLLQTLKDSTASASLVTELASVVIVAVICGTIIWALYIIKEAHRHSVNERTKLEVKALEERRPKKDATSAPVMQPEKSREEREREEYLALCHAIIKSKDKEDPLREECWRELQRLVAPTSQVKKSED